MPVAEDRVVPALQDLEATAVRVVRERDRSGRRKHVGDGRQRACRTTVVDDQPRAVVAHGCRVGLHRAADLHRLPLNLLAHALVHRSALGDGRDERDRARRVARIRCRSQVDEARLLAHDATAVQTLGVAIVAARHRRHLARARYTKRFLPDNRGAPPDLRLPK